MTHPDRRSLALMVSLLALVACGGAGGPAGKAESVLRARMQDPNAAGYVFQIAEDPASPAIRTIFVEALSAGDFDTALAASHALVESDDPAVAEAMREAFASKRGAVKMNAALALAARGDEDARAWLLEEVSRGGRLNPTAFELLAAAGEQEALVEILQPFLGSDDLATRNEAYAVLGEIGQPWTVELLLEGLEAERGEDRVQPIVSLGRAGDPAAAAAIVKFVDSKGLVFASLETLGALGDAGALDAVTGMLDHEEPLVRVYAAAAAWRLGDGDAAAEVIEPLAADEDPVVRRNVAEQLDPVADPRATRILIGLVDDEDADVRIAAIRALDTREGAEVEQALIDASADDDYQVASAALVALAEVGSAGAIDAILPLLDAQNPYVAVAAAHAVLTIDARSGATAG